MGKDLKGKELGIGITQRKDGSYLARYVDRFGERQSLYGRNLKDLTSERNMEIYKNEMKLNVINTNITLNEWFSKWMEIHKYKVVCDNTRRHYTHVYKKHISPILGKFKLQEITHLQIKSLINSLDKSGLQYETQNKVRILLLDMCNKAMIDDLLNKNPARGIKLEKPEKEVKALTNEFQAEFFECCKGTFYDNLFTVAISSGLRPGEVCALTLEDINFEKMEIDVNKTLLYQKLEGDEQKMFHFDPPKTKLSKRKVPITKQCEIALKKQMLQKNVIETKSPKVVEKQFSGLLFTTKFNTPINAEVYNDAIKRIIDEINLIKDNLDEHEYFSAHALRHTFATRCFESGIEPKIVQEYLGHASLKMTMDLYTHVFPETKSNAIFKLEEELEKNESILDDESVNLRYNSYCLEKSNKSKVVSFKSAV